MDVNPFETANAGFAQALYEDWLRDPTSVSAEWAALFLRGIGGLAPPARPAAPAAEPAVPAVAAPAGGVALRGPALRLAQNMDASLAVPTATTFREVPVARLEAERSALNAALKAVGRDTRLSFTHLIAFALVEATKRHRVMGHTYAVTPAGSFRVEPDGVALGIAVDVTRKDGSRGLVVPVIRRADDMDFGAFHAAYEALVQKARANTLLPDDFTGATMTLTNPGGLGTVASVPRLMAGQGSIIAVGAIGHAAAFRDADAAALRALGVGKVMTVTSTYDHRVIQGAESGQFLATVEALLTGAEPFYEAVWRSLGLEPGSAADAPAAAPVAAGVSRELLYHVAAGMGLVKAFRTHGHLAARLDPLGSEPIGDPALDPATLGLTPEVMAAIPADVLRVKVPGPTLRDAYPQLQHTYCGTLAYEVEHISDHEQRVWLRAQVESGAHRTPLDAEARRALLARLTRVEALEQFLHKAYLGQKRFSIEGLDMMVPMLDLTIALAAEQGARDVVIGMAHRGRLNVLAHIVGRPTETILAEFEGGRHVESGRLTPEGGTGDVKYHHGAEGAYVIAGGRSVTVTLSPNPSHLEFVGPVVDGRTRARQTQRRGSTPHHDPTAAVPVIIHGDAAFAGQGVVAETLNLGALAGYGTGGTVHLIANNQVGFTTDMGDSRSTRYASDLAKGFDVPIIHVNADDAEACLSAVRLAMAYRARFANDVVIDLVGYRRHGHNEGDEPGYTQPLMVQRIRQHPTVRKLYAERLVTQGVVTLDEVERGAQEAYQALVEVQQQLRAGSAKVPPAPPPPAPGGEVATAVDAPLLESLNAQLLRWPEGFAVHPKLVKQLGRRRSALGPDGGIDWAHAETLALASLLAEGVPVRLTGQDVERGTFSQRHLVLHDAKTGARLCPMQQLPGALAPFELHNSPLSELATLGFEYGYSAAAPEALVVWEAQFGDFINGAQVIVDQFIVSGLSKWGLTTRLTLLLPHGYEGQGPEHSSARLERFLQLCAEDNIRVANCTTPAQYFHLLRRQARRTRQRPLVLFTPKSLLRHPLATSRLEELAGGRFAPVLDDPAFAGGTAGVTRVALCSGKVYYDLLAEGERLGERRTALVRLEQLYSFPHEELAAVLQRYDDATELVWVQEEPRNMGAWGWIEPRLRDLAGERWALGYVGRPDRASPAEGYPAAHAAEQARLVAEALGRAPAPATAAGR